jgi:5'-3' exonuclease
MNGFMLIDGNSLGYAAQNTQVLTANGMETQAIYQTLKMLKKARENYPEYGKLLWLWDGRANFRFDLLPDYKGNRKNTPEKVEIKEKYHAAKPYIQQALTHLGVDQVISPEYEADDLAGYFSRKLQAKDIDVLLLTGDQDWLQLINGKTRWHDPRSNIEKHCNKANFHEFTGVESPAQFLECKSLIGDSSDNIPGVPGIGDKASILIMENFGSIRGLLADYKANGEFDKDRLPNGLSRFKKKINDFCAGGVKDFVRNYKLMNLNDTVRDDLVRKNASVVRGKRDFEAFADLSMELSFLSITRDLKSWERTFK